jgi:tRNA(Ile)-lysidine synthase
VPIDGAALEARFIAEVQALMAGQSGPLGLAVSGGSDSTALLYLASRAGIALRVATVDHGLRAESAAEAQAVARLCAQMGHAHDTLRWQGWDGRGNVQDRARRARRTALADWAGAHSLGAVALAHTQDDLAEGLILRLARGAGVDGLAAMQPRFVGQGAVFVRPLLWAARADLRRYLHAVGGSWIDDPSNEMTKFDRIRVRKAMPDLAQLGLSAQVLAGVAQHMAQARRALEDGTDAIARDVISQAGGIITLAKGWQSSAPELQRRLIQRCVLWLAPADYAPRGAALTAAIARIHAGAPTQLGGAHFLPHAGQTLAFREARRAGPPVAASQVWDNVWRVVTESSNNFKQLRALGAGGLTAWPEWRNLGLPRAALLSVPSIWAADTLIATPFHTNLGQNPPFLRNPAADLLYDLPLSH